MRKISLLIISLMILSVPNASSGELGKKIGRLFKKGIQSVAVAGLNHFCEKYSPEATNNYEASTGETIGQTIFTEMGFEKENISRGVAWTKAADKYDKQKVVKDVVLDFIGDVTNEKELVDKFKAAADSQIDYMREYSRALTPEEKKAALDKRNHAYIGLAYDVYEETNKRKSEYLAKKINISESLKEKGYDPSLSMEIASSIIAIQKADLPEEERSYLLKQYGYDSNSEVNHVIEEVVSMSDEDIEKEFAKEKELEEAERIAEQKRKEEEIRIQKEEAKRLAIIRIEESNICEYVFDDINLSESQKCELDSISDILKEYQDLNIVIIGHTCKIGYKNINKSKGLRRAEAAKSYLLEKGILANRITCDSKGELEPIADNKTPENRAKNRRIDFKVVNGELENQ